MKNRYIQETMTYGNLFKRFILSSVYLQEDPTIQCLRTGRYGYSLRFDACYYKPVPRADKNPSEPLNFSKECATLKATMCLQQLQTDRYSHVPGFFEIYVELKILQQIQRKP